MAINHTAYVLEKSELIRELNSEVAVYRHRKSGARVMFLTNDDENKVFCIGFRTPPADDTGIPHILEHSVLCGSEKYPVKEVFVELCKGSLNTFLNAMTYPDKTVYPIASCNDKDFQNLMDVYMASVFHPSIYDHPEIFLQEGWHYNIESPEEPLTVNGVVYNEMKGTFSTPEEVLARYMKQFLFPDNAYAYEAGGDPENIPDLTYERFLRFHRDYYHPANSYIYLYGNLNVEEKLDWLDREYLSEYEWKEIDSEIRDQEPFKEPVSKEIYYSIGENESGEGRSYLAASYGLTLGEDSKLDLAFDVLEYALLDVPGAPLKQAILDAGIARDVYGGYGNGMKQATFNIVAKHTDREKQPEFVRVIRDTLKNLCENGMDKKTLRAGMSHCEFKYREADFGSIPKGLVYGLQCMDSWLYNDDKPYLYLPYEENFAWLKEKIEEGGYFEKLIETWLLNNNHVVYTTMAPVQGLEAQRDARLAERMAARKAAMSQEEIETLIEEVRRFRNYQEEEDSEETLKKIPLLSVSDIGTDAEKFIYEKKELGGHTVIHTPLFTGGINYVKLLFPIDGMSEEELHWLSLLGSIWGQVDTENHSYLELSNEVNIQTGGMGCEINAYQRVDAPGSYRSFLEVSFKALREKMKEAVELTEEILFRSVFTNEKRLREIIAQIKSRSQMYLLQASHAVAVLRASAYRSPYGAFSDCVKGYGFYRFVEDLEAHFEERSGELAGKLQEMAVRCLRNSVLLDITADEEGYEAFAEAMRPFLDKTGERENTDENRIKPLGLLNEGLRCSGGVQYVARSANFRMAGYEYTGALQVLKTVLGFDYLWGNLRVKGGAYGCMCGFGKSGDSYLASYRDPQLRETNKVYEGIPAYLEGLTMDERERTKYIIGTISELDTPMTPQMKGARALSAWLSGITDEMQARERSQILNCTQDDLRALAPLLQSILDADQLCVIGSEEKIMKDRNMFGRTENLFA